MEGLQPGGMEEGDGWALDFLPEVLAQKNPEKTFRGDLLRLASEKNFTAEAQRSQRDAEPVL